MVSGCTLVISPLLALIRDQIMHLNEAGGSHLTYRLSYAYSADNYRSGCGHVDQCHLAGGAKQYLFPATRNGLGRIARAGNQVMLCDSSSMSPTPFTSSHLTRPKPEKIAKSKTLISALEKLYRVNKLGTRLSA